MSFFKKGELKALWPFYSEALIGTMLFILIPFEVLYFSSIGLPAEKIGLLLAITTISALIFEIPTGVIADLYGRKFSVILGWVLISILYFTIPISNNFYFLLIAFALIGIASTFASGSFEAWVVDLLKERKLKSLIHDYFTKRTSFYNLAFVISGILGSICVALFGIKSIWYFSGVAYLISIFFLLFGKEDFKRIKFNSGKALGTAYKHAKESVIYSYKNRILTLLLSIVFMAGILMSFESFISWTPLLTGYKFPDFGFGYLWAAMGIVGVIAPFVSRKLTKNKNEKKILIGISLAYFIWGFFVLFANSLIFFIILLLLSTFMFDFEIPLFDAYFQRFLPSKKRATIGSIRGMLNSFAGAIALPISGFLITKIGPRYTIFTAAMLILITIFFYSRIKEKR